MYKHLCFKDDTELSLGLGPYIDFQKNKSEGINVYSLSLGTRTSIWFKTPNGISYKRDYGTVANLYKKNRTLPHNATNVCITGFNDLKTTDPGLIEYWDFKQNDKNAIFPDKVTRNSGKLAYFKCFNCGKITEKPRYITSVSRNGHTFCNVCSRNFHTSYYEQIIYFYVKKIFPDVINGYKDIFNEKSGNWEIDVYIPKYNIGIEYDGGVWHKSKLKQDTHKYKVCREHNMVLLRVDDFDNDRHNFDYKIRVNKYPTNDDFKKLFSKLYEISGDTKFMDVDIDIKRDEYLILKSYRRVLLEKSFGFKNPEAVKLWDYEKNKGLSPFQISANTIRKFWFTNEFGSFQKKPNHITQGRPCRHPHEGKLSVGSKRCLKIIVYDTNTKKVVDTNTITFEKEYGISKDFQTRLARGTNNHFTSDNKFIIFNKEKYTPELLEKTISDGPTVKHYTFKEISDVCLVCKNYRLFRSKYQHLYSYAKSKGWLESLPYYTKLCRVVVMMDSEYNIIRKFKSCVEATTLMKIKYNKSVNNSCNHGGMVDGHYWAYEDDMVYFF